MAYECTSCGERYDRFMRRPMACLTKDACNLIQAAELAQPQTSSSGSDDAAANLSALTIYSAATEKARERLAREAASPRLLLGGHSYILCDGVIIGRQGDVACEALVADRSVSRRHAQLRLTADGWRLRNLAVSGSPLLVDGQQLKPESEQLLTTGSHRLRFGDTLTVDLEIP